MNKQSKDYKARKKIGQFFTENKLAEKLIELFGLDFNNKVIVEPSCGDGVFIKQIIKSSPLFKNIIGIDIDKKTLSKLSGLSNNIELKNKDFLKLKISNVDVVIGNPPFNLKVDNFVDSTEAFILKGIDILKTGGELILIIPNTVLRSQKYQKLRTKILNETKIIGIVDTRGHEFLGADVETVAIYLKKEKTNVQEYYYISNGQKRDIVLERNIRDTILLYNRNYYNIINSKILGCNLEELFYVRRGNCKVNGLKGRDLDFYNDIYYMHDGNSVIIAIQNIAYRLTANVVRGDLDKISDTITMLIPKKNMTILEMKYIANYLNSSVAYYNLHINCLNNSRLTIHMDKYYIDDIKIPSCDNKVLNDMSDILKGHERKQDIINIRNDFFYNTFSLDLEVINEIEKFWKAPKYKLKEGSMEYEC